LEAYIGNGRLLARANILFKRADITLEEMSAKAQAGNTKALRFWEEMGTHLGNGLAGVVNLLNPKRIVIGGGVSNNFQFISKAVAKVIARRAMTTQSSMVKVVRAALGNDAGIIGAQVLVRNAHA
jgi:glucokinase